MSSPSRPGLIVARFWASLVVATTAAVGIALLRDRPDHLKDHQLRPRRCIVGWDVLRVGRCGQFVPAIEQSGCGGRSNPRRCGPVQPSAPTDTTLGGSTLQPVRISSRTPVRGVRNEAEGTTHLARDHQPVEPNRRGDDGAPSRRSLAQRGLDTFPNQRSINPGSDIWAAR